MTEKRNCSAEVWLPGAWHARQCDRAGKYEEGGKLWCGTHLPSRVAARRAERKAKWEAESKASVEKWKQEEHAKLAYPILIEALVRITLCEGRAAAIARQALETSGYLKEQDCG